MKSKIVRVVLNANREDDRCILDYFLYAGKPMSKLFKIAMSQYLCVSRQQLLGQAQSIGVSSTLLVHDRALQGLVPIHSPVHYYF